MNYIQTIQDCYIAYYGRPADPGGLDYWVGRLDAAGGDLTAIVDAFGTSAEFTERFGDLETTELINAIYQRLFKRDAEEGGLSFYANMLDSGEKSLGSIALDILNGTQGDDLVLLDEKRAVAEAFTFVVDEGDLAYTGARGVEVGTNVLDIIGSYWTETWRESAEDLPFPFKDMYIQPIYMATQFASQLDGDPTFTNIDLFGDVGRKSQDALYLPWAGDLTIEGTLDGQWSKHGTEVDIDTYRLVDLPPGNYDIDLDVDGSGEGSGLFIFAHRHDTKQYSGDNDIIIDAPDDLHFQFQTEDPMILSVRVYGDTGAGDYTLTVTQSDDTYPTWNPDWVDNPVMDSAIWYGLYDYVFI